MKKEEKRTDSELPHVKVKDLFEARNGARIDCGMEVSLQRAEKLLGLDKELRKKRGTHCTSSWSPVKGFCKPRGTKL